MTTAVIDMHSHCIPPRYLEAARAKDPALGARIESSESGGDELVVLDRVRMKWLPEFHDEDLRVEDMDTGGVDQAVLSLQPVLYHYWAERRLAQHFVRVINEGLAQMCASQPRRFAPMGTVPLQFPDDCVRELRYAAEELGMRSIQIGTHADGWSLDNPGLLPLFEAAEDLGVLVFVHPSQGTWSLKDLLPRHGLRNLVGQPVATGVAAVSLVLGGVMARFPKLKICLAHGGGILPAIHGRVRHGSTARDDTPQLTPEALDRQLSRFYFDTLTHDDASLRFLIEAYGSSHVMVGSDYPFPMGDRYQADRVRALGLAEEDEARILRGNAMELFGLDDLTTG